jgi:hypothetical protein
MRGVQIPRSSPIRPSLSSPKVRIHAKNLIVDNGDNDGRIIPEYFDNANNSLDASRCIESWLGNMRCDAQNNQAKCGYDKGDCCLKSCLKNCQIRGYSDA